MVTRISNMMKINKTKSILDVDKIVYMTKDEELYIKFVLNLESQMYEFYERYESRESRNQWYAKITKELGF